MDLPLEPGEFFDGLNAGIYAIENDMGNASISIAAMTPLGTLATAKRLAKGVEREAKEVSKAVASSRASSRVLARNMEQAGTVRPKDTAAHHIVAGGAKKAADGRAALKEVGIDINSEANGVFLPRNKKSSNPTGAAVHSKIHTKVYYDAVNDTLADVSSREEAVDVLSDIRSQLLSGGYP